MGDDYMTKRVAIAGCRNFNDYEKAKKYINICISNIKTRYNLIFLSGGCQGADSLGERYAQENGYKVELYPADWVKFGKSAGPKRNKEMAQAADFVICFWDNKSPGTKSMIEYTKKLNKPLKIIYI